MRKTKIICTIGPVTESIEMLEKLAAAGMNVARLNMSHGDHESHAKIIQSIKQLNQKLDHPVAILLDTQGPEIRTGDMVLDLGANIGAFVVYASCCGAAGGVAYKQAASPASPANPARPAGQALPKSKKF